MQQFNQKFFELLRTNIFDKPCRWENNLIFFRKSTNFGRFLDLKAFFHREALSAANDRFLNSCGLKMGYIDVGDMPIGHQHNYRSYFPTGKACRKCYFSIASKISDKTVALEFSSY